MHWTWLGYSTYMSGSEGLQGSACYRFPASIQPTEGFKFHLAPTVQTKTICVFVREAQDSSQTALRLLKREYLGV